MANTLWTSYFKNGVPAQTLDSRDKAERLCHIQLALGGARGVAVTSMTGTGRMASPPLAEGGKHAVALQEWTLPLGHPGSSRPGPRLALRCRRTAGPAAFDTDGLCCTPLRHSPTMVSMMAHLSCRGFVVA